jgi:hypothetical protein
MRCEAWHTLAVFGVSQSMKRLSFIAFFLLVVTSGLEAQWLEPQIALMSKGDFDRPHPVAHHQSIHTFSLPSSGIPNWPFPNIDVTNSPDLGQFEPSVAINPLDSNNVIIGLIDDSSFSTLGYSLTTDAGATWSRKLLPDRTMSSLLNGATDPSIAFDPEGSAYFGLGFYDTLSVNNAVSLFQSSDHGAKWQELADAFISAGDTNSDKYYMTVDRNPKSRFAGRIYMTWVDQEANSGYVSIVCAYSSDTGKTWSERRFLSGLGHYTAPVPTAEQDGMLLVAYVDYYRNNEIYLVRSNDGGVSFEAPVGVAHYANVGPLLPDDSTGYEHIGPPGSALCINSFPSIAISADTSQLGRAYLTWCGKGSDSLPHIWIIVSDDDGAFWSNPVQVDDDSIPNPAGKFFPWVAVDPSTGCVGVAYYAASMDTALVADLYLSHSTDFGNSFVTRRISNASFNPITYQDARFPEGETLWFYGDYIGLAAKSGTWFPAWCDARSGDAEIYTSIVQPFAPMPVTNLTAHDTNVNGKLVTILTWQYTPETTFGYPLPTGYQFKVAKDGSLIGSQNGNMLTFADTNGQTGREYEVTVQSGSLHSITDSVQSVKSGVAEQVLQNSSIRFANEPAIAGREDNIIIDCGEACSATLTFYDELGREVGAAMSDGIVSAHHELQFMPEAVGVKFFVLKESSSTGSTEMVGKISVIEP